MTQLVIQVPGGYEKKVLDLAGQQNGINLSSIEAAGPEGSTDLLLAHVANDKADNLIQSLQEIPEFRLNFSREVSLAYTLLMKKPRNKLNMWPSSCRTCKLLALGRAF